MTVISVCKNVIASNNKKGWVNPSPPIRLSRTKNSPAFMHVHNVDIRDKHGEIVATIVSSTDGKPVIKCGAKVGIFTKYPTGEFHV